MKTPNNPTSAYDRAIHIISSKGGTIRTAQALAAGIHPATFYRMRDRGALTRVSHGLYQLADKKPFSEPDLVTVALRVPRAVICLVSALAFHKITTQVPHKVDIALEKGAERPRLDHPPLAVHRFSPKALQAGVKNHRIDTVNVRVYDQEKTIADCFKFRNQIGMDIVLEALRLYKQRSGVNVDKLLAYARICRIENNIRPYLEAIL